MAAKPSTCKRLVVQKLTTNFRDAVTIEDAEMCHPKKAEVCIKNKYVGINASDVNISKGRYFERSIPFGVGFEGVGEIVQVGEDVKDFKVGQSVTYINSKMNTYAEYVCVSVTEVYPIPETTPAYLTLLVSGLTAAIGLDKAGRITSGDSVLVTAAAGGTGQFAVQWAKAAGCHVIATCSSEEKEKILKDLGSDRVINYRKEDMAEVLAKEYPKGVDVVWETIGGKVYDDCLKNLAIKGRLLVIGKISAYKHEDKASVEKTDLLDLPGQLLYKSASVTGFFLLHYGDCFASYFKYLSESLEAGNIKVLLDNGEKSTGKEFVGMEGIIRGVEHLHSGKSIGKVYARVS